MERPAGGGFDRGSDGFATGVSSRPHVVILGGGFGGLYAARALQDAIEARLEEFRRHAIVPALLSIHSFTPVMNGNARPWHIGVLWDRDARIPVPLMENLAATGEVIVGDNLPYSGRHPADYTVARHAERAGLPHVCIEVRQDLIQSPQGVERWSEILGRCLAPILAAPNLRMR